MPVNKYTVRLKTFDEDTHFKIPVNLEFASVDQAEVVNRDFVEEEVENAINPIVDYETTRFIPLSSTGTVIKDLKYKPIFLDDSGALLNPTYYSNIGFSNDDIKFQKNRFKKSFLRLSFYDSDVPTDQNLVSFITIFCRLQNGDLRAIVDANGTPSPLPGIPETASNIPVRFELTDPILQPEGFHEGFHLYYFKNELKKNDAVPKELYMRADFNNAATGKLTRFITTPDTLPINELIGKLHTRYLLTRTNTGYYYSVDPTYNNAQNIVEDGTRLTINLYEIKVQ